jgi:DNA-binding NarL/FixJ family response regulator
MIRIMIADDHGLVRFGLKRFFSFQTDILVTGEAESGAEVLEILGRGGNFDLLLLDLSMPGISGFELLARIRAANKSLPILVFSIQNATTVARRVFQIGASGFISKGCAEEMLVDAVRKVATGGRFLDPSLTEQLIFDLPPQEKDAPHHKLSERELLILKLFAQGKTGNEIAEMLAISKKTVSTHKTNLMLKMNFNSLADMVIYATDYGLID